MSGIGGIVHWDNQPVELSQVRHMMQIVDHRGPDRIHYEVKGRVGLGHALLAMMKSELQQLQPVWLPDSSCGIVADASIYNRNEILSRLGNVSWWQEAPSDAAVILAAYQRWGEDLLGYLDGDFAFAIWDKGRECIFAARDPFGAKPFFYYRDLNRLLFGSEPKQLLSMPGVPVEPDETTIGAFLLWSFKDLERTFFQKIRRLKPAHYLLATSNNIVQKRWWNPDLENEIFYQNPRDYFDQFRELLKSAITKRLQTDYPVGAYLSGGFDSPSIVVLAEEIYRQSSGNLPPLETISAVYGNLPCDESYYIEAVTKQVSFPSNTFSPLDEVFHLESLEGPVWQTDSPFGEMQPAFFEGCARAISQIGARISLDGVGGDEVAQFDFDLGDLARKGKLLAWMRESYTASGGSADAFLWLIYGAFLKLVPESMRWRYRQMHRRKTSNLPDWISPEFAAVIKNHATVSGRDAPRFKSLTQKAIFDSIRFPISQLAVETAEAKSSYRGFESRHPYFDRSLVEFILAIPLDQRLSGERWRYMHRCGLAAHLPHEILGRKDQTYFTSYIALLLRESGPKLRDYLFSSDLWDSAPYVHRSRAEALYQNFIKDEGEANYKTAWPLFQIAYLELWLRQLLCYSAHASTVNDGLGVHTSIPVVEP